MLVGLTTEKLAEESPEVLERSGRENRMVFVKDRLTRIGLGVLALVFFGGLGFLLSTSGASIRPVPQSLVEVILRSPMDTMDMLGRISIIGGLAMGVGLILYQLVKLAGGPPGAGQSPRESVDRFYNACLPGNSGLGVTALGGFVCLLSAAKEEFGNVNALAQHWKEVHAVIQKELNEVPIPEFNAFYPSIESVHMDQVSESIVSCTIDLAVEARWDYSGSLGPTPGPRGSIRFSEDVELGRVGSHWYLASGRWSGQRSDLTTESASEEESAEGSTESRGELEGD